MSIEERFNKAVWLIRNGPPKDSDNDTKLGYYKYFKQATVGDNTTSKPWAVQLEASAKWNAWDSVKGMSKEDAMKAYVDLLTKSDPDWESHPKLAEYKP
ncbi:acyl-CoA binding protein [Salpingoeca rosetta]|uniref:Acyl-CoA binding protein n=1 Tax=Salpingoeca rosetta (strain ATCC 50818 / BSB-021) TaxID=946362 RepID=F2U1N8_SALR5|nr:acyl-CoA binding protein [Salpingoeca rosetta]EGD81540.1 acyl-CoA binding protein [Salpingoeca rosetta]|eukprot:XP_004996744.1 acyl-CoA binding protein [Salpingoeca rosetta]